MLRGLLSPPSRQAGKLENVDQDGPVWRSRKPGSARGCCPSWKDLAQNMSRPRQLAGWTGTLEGPVSGQPLNGYRGSISTPDLGNGGAACAVPSGGPRQDYRSVTRSSAACSRFHCTRCGCPCLVSIAAAVLGTQWGENEVCDEARRNLLFCFRLEGSWKVKPVSPRGCPEAA
jgi:hypothetical protein